MSENKASKSAEKTGGVIGGIIVLIIIVQVGIALFGDWFQADKTVMNHTSEARDKLSNALFLTFFDYGRLEIRQDYTVHAYISKKNYTQVAYPDRDEAISAIGKVWCEDKGINSWYIPKVVIRDIQTGEDLGTYRCLSKFTSKK